MNDFVGIIEFVAVAESKGFAAAAKRLGCSTSHVSRQVSKLEARLGCALFARTTRLVSMTPNGHEYFHRCKDLIHGLEHANETLTKQQVELNGTLRVSGAGAFAERFVAPALMEFASHHPALIVDMDFNSRNVNFVEEGIDFAIRYGQLADSSLVAKKLVNRPMLAVASHRYIEEFGRPKHPDDLKHHSCILSNNDHWKFQQGNETFNVKVNGRWRSNNSNAVVAACKKNLGIAYMPKTNFSNLVQTGELVPVLEAYCRQDSASWIVYQNRQFLPNRARLAIDFLVSYFDEWQE